jgi:hypothetical protein
MTTPQNGAAVAEGKAAWDRVHHATTFEAWKTIAAAVAIGRQHALHEASANRPFGTRYGRAFNGWLDANGFRDMPFGVRTACCKLVDHLSEIEAWRASLPEIKRADQCHPETVLRHWRRATAPSPQHRAIVRRIRELEGKPVYWSQDAMRRAHRAMLESRSSDLLILARVALEAAIRTDGDLLALLETSPTRAPAKPAPVEVTALA